MKSIKSIVLATANVIATKDLSRVLMATGYPEATSKKLAGVKMSLTKSNQIAKGIKPLTIEQSTKPLNKAEVAEFRKSIIASVDVLDNKQIGVLFDISSRSVSAYDAHVTMGNVNEKKVAVRKGKKIVVVDSRDFTNTTGKNKAVARAKMIAPIIAHCKGTKRKQILSLPHSDMTIEKTMKRKGMELNYEFVERDPKVFLELCKNVSTSGLNVKNLHCGDFADRLKIAKPNQFASVIADYCGAFTSFHGELTRAIKRNVIEVGGTLAMTFCRRGKFPKALNKHVVTRENGKVDDLASMTNVFNSFEGYEVIERFPYSDTTVNNTKGSNMVLIIVQRKA
jgi:hypothetical protein